MFPGLAVDIGFKTNALHEWGQHLSEDENNAGSDSKAIWCWGAEPYGDLISHTARRSVSAATKLLICRFLY